MRANLPFRAVLTAFLAFVWLAAAARAEPQIVVDVASGQVLSHEEAFARWHPASLTKLMTAYVAFRAVKNGEKSLTSGVRISKYAASKPPSKMGYPPGSVLTLDNALKIIMVKSANDVATAIAENVAGSESAFVARMNAEARRLGMTDTHFVNPHGLHSSDQYTTARDMALLAVQIRREFPQHDIYFSLEAIRAGQALMTNYNTLIGRFPGADGMKTGFVCASGFNLVASATRGGRTLVAVVMGAASPTERALRAAELLAQGFAASPKPRPTLASLTAPAEMTKGPVDMREAICSQQARSERHDLLDEKGKPILNSPHLIKMDRPPVAVVVSLGGASDPGVLFPEHANVPVPTPRPDYRPAISANTGDGG
jgi:D-alanyl-D-alanine carboxypeptidase